MEFVVYLARDRGLARVGPLPGNPFRGCFVLHEERSHELRRVSRAARLQAVGGMPLFEPNALWDAMLILARTDLWVVTGIEFVRRRDEAAHAYAQAWLMVPAEYSDRHRKLTGTAPAPKVPQMSQ